MVLKPEKYGKTYLLYDLFKSERYLNNMKNNLKFCICLFDLLEYINIDFNIFFSGWDPIRNKELFDKINRKCNLSEETQKEIIDIFYEQIKEIDYAIIETENGSKQINSTDISNKFEIIEHYLEACKL